MSEKKVLVLWISFPNPAGMCREGVHIYNVNLLCSLLKQYNIDVEVWLYECNEKEFRLAYADLLELYGDRVNINHIKDNFTAKLLRWSFYVYNNLQGLDNTKYLSSFKNQAKAKAVAKQTATKKLILKVIRTLKIQRLGWVFLHWFYYKFVSVMQINQSKADIILVPVISMMDALSLKGPKILILHDLFPVIFKHYDIGWTRISPTLLEAGNKFADQGTMFVAPSNVVRKDHGLKYLKDLKDEQIVRVYSPINIPKDIENHLIPKPQLFKSLNIPSNKPYFMYPSQNRLYKNIITLLKAFYQTLQQEECYLLLNCVLDGIPEIEKYVKKYNLKDKIILLGNLSNEELYSLYAYSAAATIPTRGEAGFPWQAMEGLYMKTPVIVTNIPVTLERLEFMGLNEESSGLLLFDPDDVDLLSKHMIYALHNREKLVKSQAKTREKLMEYTWDDVAREYYKLIEKVS